MKNLLAYYYNLYPTFISFKSDKYYFEYNSSKYVMQIYDRPVEEAKALYEVNKQMIDKKILVHEIILNTQKEVLTYIDNKYYVLLKVFVSLDDKIDENDIYYINNSSYNVNCNEILSRQNWTLLWETKNDYLEEKINEVGPKYHNLCNIANYYIGLCENAIYYVRNALKEEGIIYTSISHKRIYNNETKYELYNPINLIYDYRIRDICGYIKSSFFEDKDSFLMVKDYFLNNNVTYKEALLFYARLLFPSYFFDKFDDIVNNNLEEKQINKIVSKSEEYEVFLFNTYVFISGLYNKYIPAVDWIIKRSLN